MGFDFFMCVLFCGFWIVLGVRIFRYVLESVVFFLYRVCLCVCVFLIEHVNHC